MGESAIGGTDQLLGLVTDITALRDQFLLREGEAWQPGNGIVPTRASDGTPRVRGYVLDEDAYMAYVEKNAFVGIAFPEDKVTAEIHLPNLDSKPTYFIELNLSSNEVRAHRETEETRGQEPLVPDLPVEDQQRELGILNYYLNELGGAALPRPYERVYEEEVKRAAKEEATGSHYMLSPAPYRFQLPELQ